MDVDERGILVKTMLREKYSTETPFDEEVLRNYIIESGLSPGSRRSIRRVINYMLRKGHLSRTADGKLKVKYRRGEKATPKLGFPRIGIPITAEEVSDLQQSIGRVQTFLGRVEEELKQRR